MLLCKKAKKAISAVLLSALIFTTVFMNYQPAYAADAVLLKYGGANETIYAVIANVSDADVTGVSYTGTTSGTLTGEDFAFLVRDVDGGVRVDIPGIKPGVYDLTINTGKGDVTVSNIKVEAYDRSGYAHFNYTSGVGAYKDDGTLKDGAKVIYVTDDNKNTVSITSKDGTTVTGIGNILNSAGYGKGNTNNEIIKKLSDDGTPLVVRIVGRVSNLSNTSDPSSTALIEGLTVYDSTDNGGTVGDNGGMARIKSGLNITIEGIGEDAIIDGWGFHFIAESANPDYGKSFELRNVIFENTPEDAVGMEGVQVSSNVNSDLSASVERCWIHNNAFYGPSFTLAAESDKKEGDGSCDFKRGQYLTVSYNYFEGCHKTNLVGSSDSSLQYNLTYHHNFWYMCMARGPLSRNANIHMYNNYFFGQTDYAMNTRANAYIFSESNSFYMCKSPQKVDSGAIKSYNDSFGSYINYKNSTVVADKSDIVANSCQFAARNIDYSQFDTDPTLSYIPTGDYLLQEDVDDAILYIKEHTGNLGNSDVANHVVLPWNVNPVVIADGETVAPGKINKTVYAFAVESDSKVDIAYASEDISSTGVLVDEFGKQIMMGSGTVDCLKAGTYYIQCNNFQPGTPSSLTLGTFKEVNISSITVTTLGENYDPTVLTGIKLGKDTLSLSVGATATLTATHVPSTATGIITFTSDNEAVATVSDGIITGVSAGNANITATCGDISATCVVTVTEDSTVNDELSGDYLHNFTVSGKTSDFYTITGNLSTSKGTATYAGLTLTQCLKMESSTSIVFTASTDGKLTLVTNNSGAKIKVNNTEYTLDSNGVGVIDVAAGEVTITKKDTVALFLMNYEPNKATETDEPGEDTDTSLRKADDGNWYYYVGDSVDDTYTGIVKNDAGYWYVENGQINFNKSGVIESDGKEYVVKNGYMSTGYYGLTKKSDGTWAYAEAGELTYAYTGLAKNEDNNTWWFITDGVIDFTYTGIGSNSTGDYRVVNGHIDFTYNGWFNAKGLWYYMKGGMVDKTVTGLVAKGSSYYYVENGEINFNYTGLAENAGNTYYVKNGYLDFSFSGEVKIDGVTYTIKNGIVN